MSFVSAAAAQTPDPGATPTTAAVQSAPPHPCKRLLLIKFGSIGDVIMAIPAAAAMLAEGYAIDWLVSDAIAPVLRLYPWIHVLPVDEPKLLRGKGAARVTAMLALWRTLRRRVAANGAYDLCATLYYDRRYRLLTAPVRARRHISLSRTDRRFALLPGRHHTDEYARILVRRADAQTSTQLAPVAPPLLPPNPLAQNPLPLDGLRPRIVLVPAGARNVLRDDALRRWAVEHYVALAEALVARGCEVVLAGGPDDSWASPFFAALAANSGPHAFADQIGKLTLVDTLGLLDSAAVTVTHDTGPLHLAGLTSTAIVTIFGPTDPRGRLPQRDGAVALWGGEGFACRPCYDGRDYAPCPHNGCMDQITPAMVLAEIDILLLARAQGRRLPPRVVVPPRTAIVQLRPEIA